MINKCLCIHSIPAFIFTYTIAIKLIENDVVREIKLIKIRV